MLSLLSQISLLQWLPNFEHHNHLILHSGSQPNAQWCTKKPCLEAPEAASTLCWPETHSIGLSRLQNTPWTQQEVVKINWRLLSQTRSSFWLCPGSFLMPAETIRKGQGQSLGNVAFIVYKLHMACPLQGKQDWLSRPDKEWRLALGVWSSIMFCTRKALQSTGLY